MNSLSEQTIGFLAFQVAVRVIQVSVSLARTFPVCPISFFLPANYRVCIWSWRNLFTHINNQKSVALLSGRRDSLVETRGPSGRRPRHVTHKLGLLTNRGQAKFPTLSSGWPSDFMNDDAINRNLLERWKVEWRIKGEVAPCACADFQVRE